jgi:heme exporter protein A
MANENWAIEIKGITRRFGKKLVLKGIDLEVKEGESLTIFGPNGAGKTTLIKVLGTLLRPSEGNVRIAGLDFRDNSLDIRRRIGIVGHQTFLYDELTTHETLKFYGMMYDVPNLEERIQELVTKVGLVSRLHDRVRTLSRGMQQRLSIARALIHNPSIVLLDEPETGLDRYAGEMLVDVLNAIDSAKRTVVMTTHNLERGLEISDHIAILAEGRITYKASKSSMNPTRLQEAYYHYTGTTQ